MTTRVYRRQGVDWKQRTDGYKGYVIKLVCGHSVIRRWPSKRAECEHCKGADK